MDYSNLFNLIVDYSEHIGDNVVKMIPIEWGKIDVFK